MPGTRGEMGGTRQLQNVEPQLLARFVRSEHPQTVALVLSQLNPAQSAGVLASMEPAARPDIAVRIAKLDKISPAVVGKISAVIGQKLKRWARSNASRPAAPAPWRKYSTSSTPN